MLIQCATAAYHHWGYQPDLSEQLTLERKSLTERTCKQLNLLFKLRLKSAKVMRPIITAFLADARHALQLCFIHMSNVVTADLATSKPGVN